ncbi:hypothetical protein [Proteiniphilum sp.]|uniref:hypothetical protein n=1 Tax=Proteiniphilum sp. TaxID=1926877 RepID=UPI0033338E00
MSEKKIYSKDFDKISPNALNKAVDLMVETLNLSSSSVGDIQLHQLMSVYFKDEAKRKKINSIVFS